MASLSTDTPTLSHFSALIDRVYEGATNPAKWPAILAAIASWVDAPKALLFTPQHTSEEGGCLYAHGFPPSVIAHLSQHDAIDAWLRESATMGAFVEGGVAASEGFVPQQVPLTSPFFTAVLQGCGIFELLTSIMVGFDTPGMMPSVCAFFWGLNTLPATGGHSDRLRLLVPHLAHSLDVMRRLRDAYQQVAVSHASLEVLPVGVLLFGAQSQVTFANQHARRVLGEDDGLRLGVCPRQASVKMLFVDDSVIRERLRVVLSSALGPHEGAGTPLSRSISVPRVSGRTPYALHFYRLPVRSNVGIGDDTPRAIAFLTDPEYPIDIDSNRFRSLYGLTHAEVRTALLLTSGESLGDIAKTLGVSPNTLKTQVRGLYSKTGMHTRTQFVKLLLSISNRC